MKEIIILMGLPASGKSSWAREQLNKFPEKYKRINKDLLRKMLDDSKFSNKNEKYILSVRDELVEKSLRSGYSVILDDTNFPSGGKHFLAMEKIAKRVGDVKIWEKFFDISVSEAIRKNCGPGRDPVPESVIYNMAHKYYGKETNLKNEYYSVVTKVDIEEKFSKSLESAYIFDIDGTLAHNEGRRSPFDWNSVDLDSADKNLKYLCNTLAATNNILILSGRSDICQEKTEKWLRDNEISYDKLFMRKSGDSRSDEEIKEEIYIEEIKNKYNVICVFDDRNKVVNLWRALGLKCLQVEEGDF